MASGIWIQGQDLEGTLDVEHALCKMSAPCGQQREKCGNTSAANECVSFGHRDAVANRLHNGSIHGMRQVVASWCFVYAAFYAPPSTLSVY